MKFTKIVLILITISILLLVFGCVDKPVCGNGICEVGENETTCSINNGGDCPPIVEYHSICRNNSCVQISGAGVSECSVDANCVQVPVCGNGFCEIGETQENCSQDCIIDFGLCKAIIESGSPINKINFLLIPAEETQSETQMLNSISAFFDGSQGDSFSTIYPFSQYSNEFNFYYLNDYGNPEEVKSIKNIIKEKCPGLARYIYQIISTGSKLGGTRTDYLKSFKKIGYQSVASGPPKTSLAIFMHEIGHSFGGLDEGYGVGFQERGLEFYKENHLLGINLAPNWDVEGCPKWCSGEINTNSICFNDYTRLKACLLLGNTTDDATTCNSTFANSLESKGLQDPFECEFGLNCIENTNCWYIGNGFFRANRYDIMWSGSDIQDGRIKNYGPAGNAQIIKTIQTLKEWNEMRNNINNINLIDINSSLLEMQGYQDQYLLEVEFKLKNDSNQLINFFTDSILDNNILYITLKHTSQQDYFYPGEFKKVNNGQYLIKKTIGRPKDGSPVDSVEVFIHFNLPNYDEILSFIVHKD